MYNSDKCKTYFIGVAEVGALAGVDKAHALEARLEGAIACRWAAAACNMGTSSQNRMLFRGLSRMTSLAAEASGERPHLQKQYRSERRKLNFAARDLLRTATPVGRFSSLAGNHSFWRMNVETGISFEKAGDARRMVGVSECLRHQNGRVRRS